ncbi:hypothetical protein KI387_016770, partial [Taxus chinensis]
AMEAVFLLRLILGLQLTIGGICICLNELRACRIPEFGSSGCSLHFELQRDRMVFCEALQSAYRNGCFCTGTPTQEWSIVATTLCTFDFISSSCFTPVPALATTTGHSSKRTARKIISINGSQSSTIQKQMAAAMKEKQISTFTVTAMQTVGAVGGMFLLSCVIICPCFRVKKKETERPVLAHAPHS